MQTELQQFDPYLGYVPAIPEPFHGRRWEWWPFAGALICQCQKKFRSRLEYERHYALNHLES